jgi:WD40 repeat protein
MLLLASSLEYAIDANDRDLQHFLRVSLNGWRRQMIPLNGLGSHPVKSPFLTLSPDGQSWVTAGEGPEARLWHKAGGRLQSVPLLHEDIVHAVAFSPDGRTVLTVSRDRSARLWEVPEGRLRGLSVQHPNAVLAASFSPDGESFVTACADGGVRRWQTVTGQLVGAVLWHEGDLKLVAFSPDGRALLTVAHKRASEKRISAEARLWDARTGRGKGKAMVHDGPYTWASFTRDGRAVLTAGWEREGKQADVRLWSVNTGEPLGLPLRRADRVVAVAFSPNGKTILLAGSNDVELLEIAMGDLSGPLKPSASSAFHFHKRPILSAGFSPDGRMILTGSADGTAQLWDADTGHRIGESLEHQAMVSGVGFGAAGTTLVTLSWDGKVRVWDVHVARLPEVHLAQDPRRVRIEAPSDAPVLFSPAGDRLLRLDRQSKAAVVWQVRTGKLLCPSLPHQGDDSALAFSPDGRIVLTCPSEDTVQAWDVVTGLPLGKPMKHTTAVHALAFSPDGRIIVSGSGPDHTHGEAQMWRADTGQPASRPFPHPSKVLCVALAPDTRTFLTGDWNGAVRRWDAVSGKQLGPALEQDKSVVERLAFSPDGQVFLTVCKDGATGDSHIGLWHADTGQAIGTGLSHRELVTAAFSPDGKYLVTGGVVIGKGTGEARLWEVAGGKQVGPGLSHRAPITQVAFSPDGKLLLVGGADNSARLWDMTIGRPMGPSFGMAAPLVEGQGKQQGIRALAFSRDGKTIVLADSSNTLQQWNVPMALAGDRQRIRLWVQTISGKEVDARGVFTDVEARLWEDRQQALLDQGGWPESDLTMTAPQQERRLRLSDFAQQGGLVVTPELAAAGG